VRVALADAVLLFLTGLARYEVVRGRIDHALRFAVRRTSRPYVHPARHFASDATERRCPRWGSVFA
jgi:hypothetical protein